MSIGGPHEVLPSHECRVAAATRQARLRRKPLRLTGA